MSAHTGDTLFANVDKVIDGDTFLAVNISVPRRAKYTYHPDEERIRIQEIDAPELDDRAGQRAKQELEQVLWSGRRVRLLVHARDTYRRLICTVRLDV